MYNSPPRSPRSMVSTFATRQASKSCSSEEVSPVRHRHHCETCLLQEALGLPKNDCPHHRSPNVSPRRGHPTPTVSPPRKREEKPAPIRISLNEMHQRYERTGRRRSVSPEQNQNQQQFSITEVRQHYTERQQHVDGSHHQTWISHSTKTTSTSTPIFRNYDTPFVEHNLSSYGGNDRSSVSTKPNGPHHIVEEDDEYLYYVVQPGDDLCSISATHGVAEDVLYGANPIMIGRDGSVLSNTTIRIPRAKHDIREPENTLEHSATDETSDVDIEVQHADESTPQRDARITHTSIHHHDHHDASDSTSNAMLPRTLSSTQLPNAKTAGPESPFIAEDAEFKYYSVKSSDTLPNIALKCGVSEQCLRDANLMVLSTDADPMPYTTLRVPRHDVYADADEASTHPTYDPNRSATSSRSGAVDVTHTSVVAQSQDNNSNSKNNETVDDVELEISEAERRTHDDSDREHDHVRAEHNDDEYLYY
eukprot:PhM_4_TR10383/c0_g1_i3/m.31128